MSITTNQNSDKDTLVKELTIEDVYDDEELKCNGNAKEIMKHIHPFRGRIIMPDFINIPSESLTLPEKQPRSNCSSSMGVQSTAASHESSIEEHEISREYHSNTQPVTPSISNESTPTFRENNMLGIHNYPLFKLRSNSSRSARPISRIKRVCHEDH